MTARKKTSIPHPLADLMKTPHWHCYDCGLKAHGITCAISRKKAFKSAMMGNTCLIGTCALCGKKDEGIIYCIDLDRAKRAGLGEKIHWSEWD